MAGIQRLKYATDKGSVFNVLLDSATGVAEVIGAAPTGDYTENMTVRVSKNNREVGIRPRQVLLVRTINANAADANCLIQVGERYKRLPIPTKARWDAIALNADFTIGGQAYKVSKKINELIA